MAAQLLSSTPQKVVLQLEVTLCGSMLQQEDQIQAVLNEGGMLFTGEALKAISVKENTISLVFSPVFSVAATVT